MQHWRDEDLVDNHLMLPISVLWRINHSHFSLLHQLSTIISQRYFAYVQEYRFFDSNLHNFNISSWGNSNNDTQPTKSGIYRQDDVLPIKL